jgi:hypothetical protein
MPALSPPLPTTADIQLVRHELDRTLSVLPPAAVERHFLRADLFILARLQVALLRTQPPSPVVADAQVIAARRTISQAQARYGIAERPRERWARSATPSQWDAA